MPLSCKPELLTLSCRYKRTWEETPPLPLSEKLDSVVFINSNCGGSSGRTEIVSSLMQQPGVQVDALGALPVQRHSA